MKISSLLTLVFVLLFSSVVQAQSPPQGIPYQAVVRLNNAILSNQTLDLRLTIFRGGTNLIYQETHSVQTNQYGLFTTTIGNGNVVSGSFSTIDWTTGAYSMRVEVDNNGGWVNMGTTNIQSVPYSLYAGRAGRADSVDLNLEDLMDVVAPAPGNGDVIKYDSVSGLWVAGPETGGGGTDLSAGTGILIQNDSIFNIGDTNPSDDIVIGDTASGDLSGNYPSPQVAGILGAPISSAPVNDGDILKWDDALQVWYPAVDATTSNPGATTNVTPRLTGDGSAVAPLDIAQQGAAFGQVLKWNGATWVPANDSINSYTLGLIGDALSLEINNVPVSTVNIPGADLTAGDGIDIVNGLIINTGDTNALDDITITTPAGGDLDGLYPDPEVVGIRGVPLAPAATLANNEIMKFIGGEWAFVSDNTEDDDADPNNELQVLSVDQANFTITISNGNTQPLPQYIGGQAINVSGNVITNTGDPTPLDDVMDGDPAGGDLGGLYPFPTVVGIHGRSITPSNPPMGAVYVFDSNLQQWVLGTVDADSTDDVTLTTPAGGDVNGTFPNLTVVRLQNRNLSALAPLNNQVLKWDQINNQWEPGSDEFEDDDADPFNEIQTLSRTDNVLSLTSGGSITMFVAGTGIDVVGNQIINTGDVNPNDDVTNITQAGGDVNGVFSNLTVVRLQNQPVSNLAPSQGQILKFLNGQWVPAEDDFEDGDTDDQNEFQTINQVGNQLTLSDGGGTTTLFTSGQGISLSGNQINNTGDLDPSNDITDTTPAGGDLGGLYPDPLVTGLQGEEVSDQTPTNGQVLKYVNGQWQPATDLFQDGDIDDQNEIQLLSRNANQLTLNNGGGTITMMVEGAGIDIIDNQIINTGDTTANDDVNITTPAGGDVSGVYSNLTVERIQNRPVADVQPGLNQILKWNGTQWAPSNDVFEDGDTDDQNEIQVLNQAGNVLNLTNGGGTTTLFTAGQGISLSGNQINNTGDLDPGNDITDTTPAGGDLSGTYPDPTVTGLLGNPIANAIPSNNQIYKFNGTQWVPSADLFEDADANPSNELQTISQTDNQLTLSNGGGTTTLFTAGTGISLNGNQINNTGDLDPGNDITDTTPAGGDLDGVYPDPTVAGIQGNPVANANPSVNQILKWTGTQWTPQFDEINDADANPSNELQTISQTGNQLTLSDGGGTTTLFTAGSGISVSGNQIINTGDLDPGNDITDTTPAGGDLAGTYPDPEVIALRGNPVSNANPGTAQVLKWSGTQWVPQADAVDDADADPSNEIQVLSQTGNQLTLNNGGGSTTLFTAGTGIGLTGNQINNTGDTDATDDITDTTPAGGDLNGTYPDPNVVAIQGFDVSNTAPAAGEILKWSGTQWVPSVDLFEDGDTEDTNELQAITLTNDSVLNLSLGGGSVTLPQNTAGTGIDITSGVISNTGDTDASDDITNTTSAGGDLSGTYPDPTVEGLQGFGVSNATPSQGEVLKWSGSQWEPAPDSGSTYNGGTGISIVGNTITNTGDTDASDDITNTTSAGGDLSGTYPDPTVIALQGFGISGATPASSEVLKWNGSEWEPGTDSVNVYSGGTGISVSGTTITNTGDTDASDDITNTTSAGGDLSGTYPDPAVIALQGFDVSSSTPATGEVLKWSGTEWEPAADDGTVYTGGTGISVVGTVITNTGDTDASDDITNATSAGGDLSGIYPDPSVIALQGFAVSGATPTTTEVLKWNGSEWEPGADSVNVYSGGTGISVSGTTITNTGDTDASDDITTSTAAGGDLNGTYPDPTVIALQGFDVSSSTPTTGEVLKWSGTEWEPAADSGAVYTGGAGISVVGSTITNTGDTDASDDITNATSAGGDLSGTYPDPSVVALQGFGVSAATPSTGEVLKWTGTEWEAALDSTTTYTGGTGITIVGSTITNSGDTDAFDDITNTTAAGGDLNGTYPDPTVIALQGFDVSSSTPTTGEVLKWSGSEWEPAEDSGAVYTGGTGISVVGSTITNTGDTDASDDITNTTSAGGDLNGIYPDPTVIALQGFDVSSSTPASGEVLKWSGTEWEPAADDGTVYTGGAGIDVSGTTITNTGDTDASDDITTSTSAGGDLSGTYPDPSVVALQGFDVSAATPGTGEVLKWTGTEWEASEDSTTTYTGGSGISIAGSTITNTGDTDASDDITTTTAAGGDLSGIYPDPTVVALQGFNVSNATPSSGEVLKWSGTEWEAASDSTTTYTGGSGITISGTTITNSGDTDASDDITTSTSAGGDLSGTYPDPTVAALQGFSLSAATPGTGEVLKWDGSEWAPATDSGSTYTGGTGISIVGNTISNTGDTDGSDDITNTTSAGGDLSGIYPDPTVAAIQGFDVSTSTPATGEILKWTGTEWEPDADSTTVYSGGTGIAVSGTTITNTGDTDASDDITTSTAAGGDLSGTYPDPTVGAIQGNTISTATPTSGEALVWSGTEWEPATISVDDADADPTNEFQTLSVSGTTLSITDGNSVNIPTYAGGTGISITGLTITNTGDTDDSDDITNTTSAGGDLTGLYPDPTVVALQGSDVSATAPTSTTQVLKWDGTAWTPTADSVNDADADPTNEFQSLSILGNQLSLTDGNSITLPLVGASYAAGPGIDIDGSNIISNTGDRDSTDDITNTTVAGGDLSGVYPDPTVAQIQGNPVVAGTPANNQVLRWDGTQWNFRTDVDGDSTNEIQTLSLSGITLSISDGNSLNLPYVGGTGIALSGPTIINTGDTDGSDDITTSTSAGGDLNGTYPDPTVVAIQGRTVSNTTPSIGEILKWNGTEWEPDADSGSTYVAGTGIQIAGATITNIGDTDASDDITTATVAAGDLDGTYPAPTVDGLRGRAISASAPSNAEVLKWDASANEWVPDGDSVNVYTAGTGIDVTGLVVTNTGDTDASDDITTATAAAGDLDGTYPAPTVDGLRGRAISASAPSNAEVLKWDASANEWVPDGDSVNVYTAGTGIDVTGLVVTNTGDTDASDDITTATAAAGDLAGTYPAPTVDGIQGRAVSANAPSNEEILKWDASANEWVPDGDSVNVYTAGTGIDVSGLVVTNTGDTDASDDITTATAAAGDLVGTYPAPTVDGIQGRAVSANAPSNEEILKWDASANEWVPDGDSVNVYTAGTGIDVTGLVVTNTGDTDASDDITTATAAAGDLAGTYPAPTVDGIQGRAVSANAPSNEEILKWDASANEWVPDGDSVNVYTAGTGIDVTGLVVTNTGDTDASDDITTATAAAGDLAGTYPAPTVDGIQGVAVSATAPITAEFMKYDGTNWLPDSLRTSELIADASVIPVNDNTIDLGSSGSAWANIYSYNYVTVTSDRRMKENIEPIPYGMQEILKLQPVSYTWKERPIAGRQLGLIAQEVQPVIDEVVRSKAASVNQATGEVTYQELDRLGVEYAELIPVIIKGMQEQQQQMEQQADLIQKQQQLIQALEARLQQLENK